MPTSPLRVALVAHLSEVSGAGTALLEVARGLDRRRFEPLLILPGYGPLADRARAAGLTPVVVSNPERSFSGMGLLSRARTAAARLRYILALISLFRRERIDLVYANSAITVFAGLAGRLAGRPVVWHVHETFDAPSAATRLKMSLIEKLSRALIYASSTAEICFPAPSVRLRIIARNRVAVREIAEAAPLPDAELSRLVPPDARFLILANGLIRRKGADVLLQALAPLLRDRGRALHLVVTGEAPPDSAPWAAALASYVDREGLSASVTFAGLRSDMPALLKRADLFVSASRNEALPIAILEAMAAAVPVVATDVGDCRALLEEGRLGILVPPGDAPALADAVKRVLTNPRAAADRAALARAAVLRDYGPEDFWHPLESFLERAAGRPG